MSGSGPGAGGPAGEGQNPFQGLFGDLARLLGNTGSLNWDVARQVALLIAGEGQSEPNPDPVERIRLEELVRIAELHVSRTTGFGLPIPEIHTVSHIEWASRTLEAWRPLLEKLAQALSKRPEDASPPDFVPQTQEDGFLAQFNEIEKWMSPVLLGMQAGGMVGHLARRALGQYELPIPRDTKTEIVLVPSNIKSFSEDWTLPLDELSLYLSVEEVTRTSVLSRPHVSARFTELINQYVSAFEPNSEALQERLADLDLNDPSELPQALSDPQAILGAMQSPEQSRTLVYLNALVAAFAGYVDYVATTVSAQLIPSAPAIAEATKRRRVEESDGNRLVERLLGLELGQATFDRGDAFVRGVVERAGEAGLGRLWASEADLPTPAEIDAPGLWLARIDIPE